MGTKLKRGKGLAEEEKKGLLDSFAKDAVLADEDVEEDLLQQSIPLWISIRFRSMGNTPKDPTVRGDSLSGLKRLPGLDALPEGSIC